MTWTVIVKQPPATEQVAGGVAVELANGKPPYQWKHGWIPLTPDATAIKAKKRSGSAKDGPGKVAPKPEDRGRSVEPTAAQREWSGFSDNDRIMGRKGLAEARAKVKTEFVRLQRRQSEQVELTPDEAQAVDDYVNDSLDLNNGLRGIGKLTPEHKNQAELLRKAIDRAEVPEGIVVYRGLDMAHLPELRPGDVFSDRAPSSTSYDEAITREFIGGFNAEDPQRPVQLVIEVPKGSKALMLDSDDFWQRELIFGENQPFEVLEVKEKEMRVRVR